MAAGEVSWFCKIAKEWEEKAESGKQKAEWVIKIYARPHPGLLPREKGNGSAAAGESDAAGGWRVVCKSGRGLPHCRTLRADGCRLRLADGREFGCPADGQSVGRCVGRARRVVGRSAGLETRDTADWEVCGTSRGSRCGASSRGNDGRHRRLKQIIQSLVTSSPTIHIWCFFVLQDAARGRVPAETR
jgi:hypothetical protein